MASSVLAMIKEEVTCPICLELLKEPVSADCNHSFCRACITVDYESSKGKEGEGICPLCRVSFVFGNLRPNLHVANIVERLTGFRSSPEEEEKKVNVCAQHGEKLQLFCEKDMVAICWLCERSQEHRGHQTALIEEVAKTYKEKLQTVLERQMANEEKCDIWEEELQEEKTFWEDRIQSDVDNVQMEFKGLREFLDSEEKKELQKLMEEKEDIMKRLEESHNELMKQRQSVRDLISEVKSQLECSTMEMLQGVNSALTRSRTLMLIEPETVLRKQRRIFRAPDVKGVLQAFQGAVDAQCYWVEVTLRKNKTSNVVINRKKGQIQNSNSSKRKLPISETYELGALGCQPFRSGKYYWEVDVSQSDAWLLGLNDGECANPQLQAVSKVSSVSYNYNYQQHRNFQPNAAYIYGNTDCQPKYEVKGCSGVEQEVNYQPKHGYWIIGMTSRSVYKAFEQCSVTHKGSVLALSLTSPPSRVGIFLDREACTLSFYDVSNHGALIYKFYEPSFPSEVYPYFNPMESSKPMTVCVPYS